MDRKWITVSVVILVMMISNAFLLYTVNNQNSAIDSLQHTNTVLSHQLEESNVRISDLENTVKQRDNEINKLQRDIDRYRNYTLVRMLISVNPEYLSSDFYQEIQAVEEGMKFIWDPLHVAFIFQIHSDVNAPLGLEYRTSALCSTYMYSNQIRSQYSLPTVTVLVTSTYNNTASWAIGGLACSSSKFIIIDVREIQESANFGAHVITHEFLHLLGFNDSVLYPWDDLSGIGESATYIPRDWYPQIFQNIVKFGIQNPSVQ